MSRRLNPLSNLAAVVWALALNEARLRLRRLSSVVTLLAVVAVSWAMISDPAGGTALITIKDARVLYTSSALALGSAALGGLLFSLGGFYLVRGRVGEDLRSGAGSVIAATPVGNALFLGSRWLGGVAYLGALGAAFMATMLACHALRGDGPIELGVYLQTYVLLLAPMVFFVASCALLFDSWAPLMGKAGDALYFLVWMGQIALMASVEGGQGGVTPLLLLDFPGLGILMTSLAASVDTSHISIGMSDFDARLAPLVLPAALWSSEMMLMRFAAALLALLPLVPAVLLFHRFAPDRVKASGGRKRRSPLDVVNGWLRPLARLVQPLFALAARMPGVRGQVLADVALTLAAAPAAIAALLAALCGALVLAPAVLGPWMAGCAALWGLLVCDLATRDFEAGTEDLTGAVEGGAARRYARQLAAAMVLGALFMGPVALRWAWLDPVRALAVPCGVIFLSALASLLGRYSRTPRTFMALFLFGLYVALNATGVPMLDAVGFNGAATLQSAALLLAIGAAAAFGGYAWNRRG